MIAKSKKGHNRRDIDLKVHKIEFRNWKGRFYVYNHIEESQLEIRGRYV